MKALNPVALLLVILLIAPLSVSLYPPVVEEFLSETEYLTIHDICQIKTTVSKESHQLLFAEIESSAEYYLQKVLKRQNKNIQCEDRNVLGKDYHQKESQNDDENHENPENKKDVIVIDLDSKNEQEPTVAKPQQKQTQSSAVINDLSSSAIELQIKHISEHRHLSSQEQSQMVNNTEGYHISIQLASPHITITAQSNSGYIYALQTVFQLIKDNKCPTGSIRDEPAVSHRGIMIDSARHFLKVSTISKLIETMPLSKLNILHWHLADDESFTLRLDSHPELAEASVFKTGQYYTVTQVKQIIALGKKNGVAIVPEFDTPAHVRSWGQSKQWKEANITILCPKGEGYNHQFDLSKHEVYQLATEVLKEIDVIFKDSPYLHLGGDEVFGACWDLRPAIKTFMRTKLILNYGALQMYWRHQMKNALSANRTVIYWRNDAENIKTAKNDIVHYWGNEADLERIVLGSQSKIILSPFDTLYLNKGFGNIWFNTSAGSYSVWRNIYENFHVFPKLTLRDRILGAEVCLWGEVSNDDTLENNLWMRASAFAGKVWSTKTLPIVDVVRELVALQYEMYKMDVYASPITSEYCEKKPQVCFH